MKKMFILVYVTYDYYRFQQNEAISDDIKKIYEYIKKNDDELLPIISNGYSDKLEKECRDKEIEHWYIEEYYCL